MNEDAEIVRGKRNRLRYAVMQRDWLRVLPKVSVIGTNVDDDGVIEIREDFLRGVVEDGEAVDALIAEAEAKGARW